MSNCPTCSFEDKYMNCGDCGKKIYFGAKLSNQDAEDILSAVSMAIDEYRKGDSPNFLRNLRKIKKRITKFYLKR